MPDVAFVMAEEFNAILNFCSSVFALRLSCDHNGPVQATVEEVIFPVKYAEFADVFSLTLVRKLPSRAPHNHAIEIKNSQPLFGPIYLLSAVELDVLKKYIKDNLEKGFIVPSTSPAEASILFTKKKNRDLWLCVDYQGLNALTCKNKHPLPLINKVLDQLIKAKIYTRLDFKNAYNLICIKEGDKWKTAFYMQYKYYQYNVIPFGLVNAPAIFQTYINRALMGILDVFATMYLDDIMIYSKTPKDHQQHVKDILAQLHQFCLFCKLSKCKFGVTTMSFLKFVVSTSGVSIKSDRVESILNWPKPRSHRNIQVFLSFANFYWQFIKDFAQISSALSSMLKSSKKSKFSGLDMVYCIR